MVENFLVVLVLVALAALGLGVKVFFFRKKFPNTHISGNKNLQKNGISCVSSQDRNEQRKKNFKENLLKN